MENTAKRKIRTSADMTHGSIIRCITLFALPLLAGNFFQQFYNMVDAWVIGQTGDPGAYSAVGSVGPITNILIGLFSGLSSGAGVVISQYYGAGNKERAGAAAHTSAALTLILGVLFTVIGVGFTPLMLRLMLRDTKSAVYVAANEYLTIYFSGIIFMLIYNMGSAILRAVGDSRRPFYYLAAAAVINTVLDLVFVFICGMGVKGVALATIIAQAVSAALTVITLLKTSLCVKIRLKQMKIDGMILKKTVIVGIPAALQMALTAFSNVFVQSYISNVNSESTSSLGGWTTYNKIDQFVFLPIQSIALAVTTFVGQNLGAGNVARAKKGTYCAFTMSSAVTVLLMIPIMTFSESISGIFNDNEGIVEHAALLLKYMTPFYLFSCVNQVFSAAMRGAGNSTAPMIIMLSSFIGVRQIYLYIVSTFITNEFLPIAFSYPVGWGACCIGILLYYFIFFRFGKNKLVEKSGSESAAAEIFDSAEQER